MNKSNFFWITVHILLFFFICYQIFQLGFILHESKKVQTDIKHLKNKIDQTNVKTKKIENKIRGLSIGSIDKDLLFEKAFNILSHVKKDQTILFYDE